MASHVTLVEVLHAPIWPSLPAVDCPMRACPPTYSHACHPAACHACMTALEPRNKPGGIMKRVPPLGGDEAAAAAVRSLGKRVSISGGGRVTPTITPRLDAARWGTAGPGGSGVAKAGRKHVAEGSW